MRPVAIAICGLMGLTTTTTMAFRPHAGGMLIARRRMMTMGRDGPLSGTRRRNDHPRARLRQNLQRFSTGENSDFITIQPQTLGNWNKSDPEKDVFISALSANGQVGVKVISAKNMVQSIKNKRGLSDVSSELLGRVMLSAMLVAHGIKDQETLQLTFQGDGLAQGVMAISDGACNVRGWIGRSNLDELKDPKSGKVNIKAAVGKGTLQVVKCHPSWRIPYNGVVEIASGEVAPDVAYYLAASEQRNTAIGVGLRIEDGEVLSAGGFYIEMLPGVEEESIAQVEANLATIQDKKLSLDPGLLLAGGDQALSASDLVMGLLDGLGIGVAEETQPTYRCTCSKEKVFRAIRLLSPGEVEDILSKEGKILATCEFCNEEYSLDRKEVAEMGIGGQQ